MNAFTAVKTTGIYCQPACSARPNAENTHTFPLAAAAEAAGYRACMRCRPYRYPQTIGWTAPELVCRAVRLILDGALDHSNEDALARRLGVSVRHLRRLFTLHLGVTPDGLARSSRVHFARRLLDDTDLSVTEIAFAAGFGSLRQFNRACRDVFRESPRELRARRRKADRLVADGGLVLRLAFAGTLEWDEHLSYFAATAIPGVETVDGATYRRTIVIEGHAGVLELMPGGADHLLMCAHLPRWGELVHIVQRARAIANLDVAPELRSPGTWDAFETGVRAIVGRDDDLLRDIVHRFGQPVPGLEQLALTHTFPSPETLAAADLPPTITAFARAVVADEIRLDRSVSVDRLVASIAALPGADAALGEYVALRLGEPDAAVALRGAA